MMRTPKTKRKSIRVRYKIFEDQLAFLSIDALGCNQAAVRRRIEVLLYLGAAAEKNLQKTGGFLVVQTGSGILRIPELPLSSGKSRYIDTRFTVFDDQPVYESLAQLVGDIGAIRRRLNAVLHIGVAAEIGLRNGAVGMVGQQASNGSTASSPLPIVENGPKNSSGLPVSVGLQVDEPLTHDRKHVPASPEGVDSASKMRPATAATIQPSERSNMSTALIKSAHIKVAAVFADD